MSAPGRRLARFVLSVAVLYVAAMLSWGAVSAPFRSAYASAGNRLVGRVGTGRIARLVPMERPAATHDTELVLRDAATEKRKRTALNVHYRTYLPLALLVSLFLATPLPWRRRLAGLGLGLAVQLALFASQLWLLVWSEFLRDLEGGPRASERVPEVLRAFLRVFYSSTTAAFFFPVVIWGAVLCARGDAPKLLEGPGDDPPKR